RRSHCSAACSDAHSRSSSSLKAESLAPGGAVSPSSPARACPSLACSLACPGGSEESAVEASPAGSAPACAGGGALPRWASSGVGGSRAADAADCGCGASLCERSDVVDCDGLSDDGGCCGGLWDDGGCASSAFPPVPCWLAC